MHSCIYILMQNRLLPCLVKGLSEGDLDEIEDGVTDRAQNIVSAPIDNSNDENDIDEETM